jgi:hypothetical protein
MNKINNLGLGLAIAALVAGALILAGKPAGANTPSGKVYKPAEAISQYFGSKHAVGYLQQRDSACAMTMFITEDTDGRPGPSATRVRFTMKPGEMAQLASAETQSLEMTCGAAGATVEFRTSALASPYVTH